MNSSELKCTNALINYFFEDFVYKNLYVYDGKQKKELCDELTDIANCITHEELGLDTWGADDDVIDLFIAKRADYIAKKHGVKTGMALWEAKRACPDITFLPPRMDLYLRFSRMAHEIYGEYTDLQEPYGIDESWLDVTASASIKGDGEKIAKEISQRMKSELGITVSIGVSFDKIFSKLGSDYKKPDAITTMYRHEIKDKAWVLPASDLLFVGKSTEKKLARIGIHTIGDIARADEHFLHSHLGKHGNMLWAFANGYDESVNAVDKM